jgi:2-keto-4-pentenoate hydratase
MANKINLNNDYIKKIKLFFESHENHIRNKKLFNFFNIQNNHDAYEFQNKFNEFQLNKYGCPVGYKIGLTSKKMQKLCGVNQPNYGVIFKKRILNDLEIGMANFSNLGVESELCLKISKNIGLDTKITKDNIIDFIEYIAPAFELIDDFNTSYPINILSLIAENSWNKGVIIGSKNKIFPTNLSKINSFLFKNNKILDSSNGTEVLGHPFNPAIWLINTLKKRKVYIKKGTIILTGSWTKTAFPRKGDRFKFTIDKLGSVNILIN